VNYAVDNFTHNLVRTTFACMPAFLKSILLIINKHGFYGIKCIYSYPTSPWPSGKCVRFDADGSKVPGRVSRRPCKLAFLPGTRWKENCGM